MSVASETDTNPTGFRLKGYHVLAALLLFFGAVMVVNVVMIRAAVSTFGGVDTPSSYRAGLKFTDEMERVAAQQAMGWSVEADIESNGLQRVLTVDAVDTDGKAVRGLDVQAVFAHRVDERLDVPVDLAEIDLGRYRGVVEVPDGSRVLRLKLVDGETIAFRSDNEVTLR